MIAEATHLGHILHCSSIHNVSAILNTTAVVTPYESVDLMIALSILQCCLILVVAMPH
jgi:hypothetical protein